MGRCSGWLFTFSGPLSLWKGPVWGRFFRKVLWFLGERFWVWGLRSQWKHQFVVVIFRHKWLDSEFSPQVIEVVVGGIAREQCTTHKRDDFTWKFLTGKTHGEISFTIVLRLHGLHECVGCLRVRDDWRFRSSCGHPRNLLEVLIFVGRRGLLIHDWVVGAGEIFVTALFAHAILL